METFSLGRTRFAQARAELGMTDKTGGPKSPNYIHRTRPEGYEEEEEEFSDGEEVPALKARTGDPNHPLIDDEERFRRQDFSLARSLRSRAEGLEKVITSMLEQPPPVHPLNDEDANAINLKDIHRLPNGVRLRLALGTIVNDLFARQAFHLPYRHIHPQGHVLKVSMPVPHENTLLASLADLPDVLRALAPVSGAFVLRHQQSPHQPAPSPMALHSPAFSDYTTQYSQSPSNPPGSAQIPYQNFHHRTRQDGRSIPRPSQRTKELYFNGSDPSTANSPPALRCPRHLHTGCEICIEVSTSRPTANNLRNNGRSSVFVTDKRNSMSTSWKAMHSATGSNGSGITGWQEGTGVGSGLLRPAVRGSALRRTVIENDLKPGAGNTKLSKLIPRFLRLSALVAAELGREARGEEDSSSEDGTMGGTGDNEGSTAVTNTMGLGTPPSPTLNMNTSGQSPWNNGNGGGGAYTSLPSSPMMTRPMPSGQTSPTIQASRERRRMYESALRPSREWYMLLAGLLTRAVLEGYFTAGWNGLQAVQCLLLVGLGINDSISRRDADEDDEEEQFASFDPDELPDLMQATKILFPSLRDGSYGMKDQAEEEYELEMLERLRRVSIRFTFEVEVLNLHPSFMIFQPRHQTVQSTWKG